MPLRAYSALLQSLAWHDMIVYRRANMKLPLIDKALSAVHFLNGTGVPRRNISHQGFSRADMALIPVVDGG